MESPATNGLPAGVETRSEPQGGPPPPLPDPRLAPEFIPSFYPLANGMPAPGPESREPNHVLMNQFLAAYYALNRQYSDLVELRERRHPAPTPAEERRVLQALEHLLRHRDSLEDYHASAGIIAEPVNEHGWTRNVLFTFGNADASGKLRARPLTSSAELSIRLPRGVKLENLTFPDGTSPRNTNP